MTREKNYVGFVNQETLNPVWEDKVMETLTKLAQQMSHIEQKLDTKADTAKSVHSSRNGKRTGNQDLRGI